MTIEDAAAQAMASPPPPDPHLLDALRGQIAAQNELIEALRERIRILEEINERHGLWAPQK